MTSSLVERLTHPSPMLRRVLHGMGAYGYGQAVTVFTQLVTLPVFLTHWDIATYGVWLTLSAIPAYLSLADVGFLIATGNKMIALEAVGDHQKSNEVFQSGLAFLTGVSLLLVALVCTVLLALNWLKPEWSMYSGALLALTGVVVVSLFISLAGTLYTATRGFAIGTYLITTSRLVEWAGGVAGLWWWGTFAGVAIGMLVCKAIFAVFIAVHSARRTRHLRWGYRHASAHEIKVTIRPALLFAVFPLTTAFSLQGFVIMITTVLGPAATAVFSSYRTLSRLVVQLAAAVSHAMWPEFGHLHSTKHGAELQRAYKVAHRATTVIGLASSLAVLTIARWTIEHWSRGQIQFSWPLMIAFTVYAATASIWHVQRTMLMSVNSHSALARNFAMSTALSLVGGALLTAKFGIIGAVAAMAAAEIWMWWTSRRSVHRLWLELSA